MLKSELSVRRISQENLPRYMEYRFCFNGEAKEKFVVGLFLGDVISGDTRKILFVNPSVPQKDIDIFSEIIIFPEEGVADPESKTGEWLDYVYKKYGFHTYQLLIKFNGEQLDMKEAEKAVETAKTIFPLIEKEAHCKKPIVNYNEWLLLKIWKTGCNDNRNTPKGVIGYGSVYVFYLGYLMGIGKLDEFFEIEQPALSLFPCLSATQTSDKD